MEKLILNKMKEKYPCICDNSNTVVSNKKFVYSRFFINNIYTYQIYIELNLSVMNRNRVIIENGILPSYTLLNYDEIRTRDKLRDDFALALYKSFKDLIELMYLTNIRQKYFLFLLIFRFHKPYTIPYDVAKIIAKKILFFKLKKKIEKTKLY